ncbi:hypothetical protein BH09BAC2_BH09BAC2_16750 [soil metagenome]
MFGLVFSNVPYKAALMKFPGLPVFLFFLYFTISSSCNGRVRSVYDQEFQREDSNAILKKQETNFPIGTGIKLKYINGDSQFFEVVKKHFNSVTFENELKHASVVTNEGEYDFSKVDELVKLSQAAGLKMHGHALVEFQSTNNTFMRSLIKKQKATSQNLITNGNFKFQQQNKFSGWRTFIDTNAKAEFTSANVQGGNGLKVHVIQPGSKSWAVQVYSDSFHLIPNLSYTISFYARAINDSAIIKTVVYHNAYFENFFTLTKELKKYTWIFSTRDSVTNIKIQFPVAGTFFIDKISLPSLNDDAKQLDPIKVDSALKDFIFKTMTRYKNKIISWDVINEPLENKTGKLMSNPSPGDFSSGKFYFAEYLGSNYIAKALTYARQADAKALLFINEDKLESDATKLDSMVALIKRLQTAKVPLDGIGVQMHLTIKNDLAGVQTALKKLAATGLRIRISEMDVRINPDNKEHFVPTEKLLLQQRDIYRAVIGAYYKFVPAKQRYGITVWDFSDKYTWIKISQGKEDGPAIMDAEYRLKPAFFGLLSGLKNKN